MTSATISILLAPHHLAMAKEAVRSGRATSISAYIASAIDREMTQDSLDDLVRDLIDEHGVPTPMIVLGLSESSISAWPKRDSAVQRTSGLCHVGDVGTVSATRSHLFS